MTDLITFLYITKKHFLNMLNMYLCIFPLTGRTHVKEGADGTMITQTNFSSTYIWNKVAKKSMEMPHIYLTAIIDEAKHRWMMAIKQQYKIIMRFTKIGAFLHAGNLQPRIEPLLEPGDRHPIILYCFCRACNKPQHFSLIHTP